MLEGSKCVKIAIYERLVKISFFDRFHLSFIKANHIYENLSIGPLPILHNGCWSSVLLLNRQKAKFDKWNTPILKFCAIIAKQVKLRCGEEAAMGLICVMPVACTIKYTTQIDLFL